MDTTRDPGKRRDRLGKLQKKIQQELEQCYPPQKNAKKTPHMPLGPKKASENGEREKKKTK